MKHENRKNILIEELDEEILDKMPKWFKVLRDAYGRKSFERFT